jgi:mono/diheme cytochrome c family protein
LALIALLGLVPRAGAAGVDFKRDIQPIFEQRCYECHGEKRQKGGIRFDRKSTVFEGGDSGKPLILTNKPAESPLLVRVTTDDPDEVMPPKGEKLTEAQIKVLRAWVDQGASWPEDKSNSQAVWEPE